MKIVCLAMCMLLSLLTFGEKKYKLVEIETSLGVIKVKLYTNTPKHSENFLKLAKEKHYDHLLFHRVIQDFMIQGGASDSRQAEPGKMVGVSDPGYTIEAEFRPENHHFKGALAAARQGDEGNPEKRSSGEQFYIVQGKTYTDRELDQIEKRKQMISKKPFKFSPEAREMYKSVGGTPFLDGDYTVFGEVVEGMDILDKIAAVETDSGDRPKEDVVILKTKLKRK